MPIAVRALSARRWAEIRSWIEQVGLARKTLSWLAGKANWALVMPLTKAFVHHPIELGGTPIDALILRS